MIDRNLDAQFMASIGSTSACHRKHVLDDTTVVTMETTDEEASDSEEDNSEDESDFELDPDDEDALDAFMSSAAHAGKPKGISAEQLSKVWRIDLATAERTLEVTSQHRNFSENTTFSRNHPTNDEIQKN